MWKDMILYNRRVCKSEPLMPPRQCVIHVYAEFSSGPGAP